MMPINWFGGLKLCRLIPSSLFFQGKTDLDVLVYSAESGSAWSLIYPE
jgi:hypothetical protein